MVVPSTPPNSRPFYTKLSQVLISLIAIGFLAIISKEILCPLVFSSLFSIVLLPLANFFEHRLHLKRGLTAMLCVILLISAVTFILYLVGSQISDLANDWPQFKQQLTDTTGNLQRWVTERFHISAGKQIMYVQSASNKVMSSGSSMIGTTVLSLTSTLLFLVFTTFFTFFLLLYRSLLMKFLVAVFKEENSKVVYDVIEKIQIIIRKYIIGLLIEMSIVSGTLCLAFWALGIKYAILLGLITGLFNIIPYLGIFTALLISVLITFATATVVTKVFFVIAVVVMMHLIDSNVLLPVIVGSKVKINALITIIGVVVGEMMWGIPGMFLSIPVIAVWKIIFDHIEDLKPWGLLLGDDHDDIEKKQRIIKFKNVITRKKERPLAAPTNTNNSR